MVNGIAKWKGQNVQQDENNRLVTDAQIGSWDNKAEKDHKHAAADVTGLPESLKNPNALSIQLNSGIATEYDGSSAKSIDITPANIGAYKVATGVEITDGKVSISNSNGTAAEFIRLTEKSNDLFISMGFSSGTNGNEFYIGHIPSAQIRFNKAKNRVVVNGELDAQLYCPLKIKFNNGTTEGTDLFTYNNSYLSANSSVINITPAAIGALASSDVFAWAKAETKPTYTFVEITEKPDTYAPSAHTHKDADIESLSADKITGTIGIDHLPKGALERLVPVANDEARFKLTTDDVQLGDTVKVENTGLMYYVVDETKLAEEAGYSVYTAGAATSVPWSGITDKPDTFTPSEHNHAIANVTGLQTALEGKAPSKHSHVVAEISDFPTSLKNPNALSIQLNGGTANTYDGSAATSLDITPAAIGAATESHIHDSVATTDWDTAITSGSYYAAVGATNNPTTDAAYSGTVVKGATIVTQEVVKETTDGDLYKYIRRGQLDDVRTAVTAWGNWQEIHYVAG